MNLIEEHIAYGEQSERLQAVDFDWSFIDRAELERQIGRYEPFPTHEAMARITRWVFQDGMNDPRGLRIRAIIVCWLFCPEMRDAFTMSSMARSCGLHKQSLGRWIDSLKREFPGII